MVLVKPEEHNISDGSDVSASIVKVKTPKRVLQFCDGVLEEYSTDEEDNIVENINEKVSVDPVCTFNLPVMGVLFLTKCHLGLRNISENFCM